MGKNSKIQGLFFLSAIWAQIVRSKKDKSFTETSKEYDTQ